ncbi:MAG: aromatic ring-hydroxylating dioxygenase subunit alpha [Caldilineaceae bacterium SB0661_bin_32]|uniref:Aromatic ring-hydroxylating dioxygenase subunit alpha n=1 Tax=Caldilineaceae bacterium SB0661_bin_32 TaxID=2605255 RepID=A0A6B1D7D5_9CHLR|nr:aromatic ring-hydroxylating dioxygenase subunit alpha [Caldilineaceae bacterium SB0661_bin_32]
MPILPVEAYTSQDWYDREQERIFSRTWAFAGLVGDVREPGQYISVQAGLNNIFIVMGQDGQLRAFHNICRHRGTQLLRAVGNTKKVITCPYHDWTYDLEGCLLSVPDRRNQFPALDMASLGLKKASVASWRGMLWVHPDENADSVEDWFGGVEPYLGPHSVEQLVEYKSGRAEYTVAANWKIVVENYIDGYHLAHLHSGTLSIYDHRRIESGFVGPHFFFWEPLSPEYAANVEKNASSPLVIPAEQAGAWVPMLFPGIGLAENEDSWSVFHLTPLAPDSTRVVVRTKMADASLLAFASQSVRSYSFWSGRVRGKYDSDDGDDPMASGDFMQEDIYACEQQQKSLQSPYFEHGPSAMNGEAGVRRHQEVVMAWLGEEQ